MSTDLSFDFFTDLFSFVLYLKMYSIFYWYKVSIFYWCMVLGCCIWSGVWGLWGGRVARLALQLLPPLLSVFTCLLIILSFDSLTDLLMFTSIFFTYLVYFIVTRFSVSFILIDLRLSISFIFIDVWFFVVVYSLGFKSCEEATSHASHFSCCSPCFRCSLVCWLSYLFRSTRWQICSYLHLFFLHVLFILLLHGFLFYSFWLI